MLRPMRLLRPVSRVASYALALLCFGGCSTVQPPATQTSSPAGLNLPGPDVPLPGAGPFRRADWFERLWNERRAHFAARLQQDRGAIVFLGDSITQGWGDDLGGSFADARVANRGIGGDTSRGVLYRLAEDVIAVQPRAVVLLIGTNDIEEGATPEVIRNNVALIISSLRQAQPRLPIFLCEVFPSSERMRRPAATIRELNRLYAELAQKTDGVTLVPTYAVFADAKGDAKEAEFPDLLHPNDAGYAKWAGAVRPVLQQAGLLER